MGIFCTYLFNKYENPYTYDRKYDSIIKFKFRTFARPKYQSLPFYLVTGTSFSSTLTNAIMKLRIDVNINAIYHGIFATVILSLSSLVGLTCIRILIFKRLAELVSTSAPIVYERAKSGTIKA